jgi:hypothetical protein
VVPQVSSMQASFKWCHLVISFPSGSSQCGTNKVERIIPRRYAMIKRLQVISTSGNVTRTHLFYLLSLSYLLAWYALSYLVLQVCSCALVFHTIFLCTHLGELSLYHASLMSLWSTLVILTVVSSLMSYIWIMVHAAFSLVFNIYPWAMFARTC